MSSPHRRLRTWRRCWRYVYLRFVRLQGPPKAIARGLAVGAFAGMFPIFGFQTIVGVLLAVLVRGNKLAAAASTWISNPLTYVPLFTFNFQVGQWLLRTSAVKIQHLEQLDINQLLHMGIGVITTLFVGCSVMGAVAAVCSYGGGLWLIQHLRRHHRSQRLR